MSTAFFSEAAKAYLEFVLVELDNLALGNFGPDIKRDLAEAASSIRMALGTDKRLSLEAWRAKFERAGAGE